MVTFWHILVINRQMEAKAKSLRPGGPQGENNTYDGSLCQRLCNEVRNSDEHTLETSDALATCKILLLVPQNKYSLNCQKTDHCSAARLLQKSP